MKKLDIIAAIIFTLVSSNLVSAKNIRYTEGNNTLTIHKSGLAASIKVTSNQWNYWQNTGLKYGSNLKAATKLVYKHFKDDFDFIVFVSNNAPKAQKGIRYAGRHISIKQDVKGLGIRTHNYTKDIGSAGKLQSILHLAELNYIEVGPFLHEIAHHWGNKFIDTQVAAHFGNSCVGKEFGGQLGGCAINSIKSLGGNRYELSSGRKGATYFGGNSNGGNGVPYSELELYLMGLIPASEVPDIVKFEGLQRQGSWPKFTYSAQSKKNITINSLIAKKGQRIPSYESSQKTFRILTVVLTPKELTTKQWGVINKTVRDMNSTAAPTTESYNFFQATGKRASMKLDQIDKSTIGQPSLPISSANIPSSSANIPSSSAKPISKSSSSSTQQTNSMVENLALAKMNIQFSATKLSFTTQATADVSVNIYSLTGELLESQMLHSLPAASHEVSLKKTHNSGVYILKLTVGANNYSQQIINH